MKKILITGADSYIGTSFEKWLEQYPDKYQVDTVDMKGSNWKEKDFSEYDVVFHVAGIVHRKEANDKEYFVINRDLAVEVARKAKADGIKQFIFLSTMGVYGRETGYITKDTIPMPKTPYGKSKYEAETLLLEMGSRDFKIAVVRPPMVYGKHCKGNYPRLASLALKLPIFPNVKNQRSMIYIDNLSEFIRLLIKYEEYSLFFPQNKEYVRTSEMVKLIAEVHGKKIRMTGVFNGLLRLTETKIGIANKIFGDLIYEKPMSEYKDNYIISNFRESIISAEK